MENAETTSKENYVKYVVHVNKSEIFISSKYTSRKIYARQAPKKRNERIYIRHFEYRKYNESKRKKINIMLWQRRRMLNLTTQFLCIPRKWRENKSKKEEKEGKIFKLWYSWKFPQFRVVVEKPWGKWIRKWVDMSVENCEN